MVRRIMFGLFAVVVIAAVVFMVQRRSHNANGAHRLVKVERGAIVDKAIAIGRIDPDNEIAIKSKISGLVDKIFVEIGDTVRENDALLEIRPDPTPLEFAEAKRALELAAVAYDHAKREFDRAQNLIEKQHISDQDFDRTRQAMEESALRYQIAEERLTLIESGRIKIAGRDVESIIRSPISGTVLARQVNPGDPVVPLTTFQQGTVLLTLASMERLIFKGTVDEIDVGKLQVGMPVAIKVGALPEAEVKGTLFRISPKARKEDNTVLFDVEIELTSMAAGAHLRAGYSANAEIVISRKDSVLVLPERLVTFRADSAFVDIPGEAGQPQQVAITTGLSDGLKVEIVAGLAEGADVIEHPPREIR